MSKRIVLVIVVLILIGVIILFFVKQVQRPTTFGGAKESRAVMQGSNVLFSWDPDVYPEQDWLGIFFENGPTPGVAAVIHPIPSDGQYVWKVPRTIVQGDVGTSMLPGHYTVRFVLYDREPCLGLCPYPSQAKVLRSEELITLLNINKVPN